jgi:hypothetical protein
MIRFVDLGKQIAVDEDDPDYPRQFAFYNTISDQFIDLGGNGHVWDSWIDILKYAHADRELLDRLWDLSPEWTKEGIHPDAAARLKAGPTKEEIDVMCDAFFRGTR